MIPSYHILVNQSSHPEVISPELFSYVALSPLSRQPQNNFGVIKKKTGDTTLVSGDLTVGPLSQTVMAQKKFSNCLFPVIFGSSGLVLPSVQERTHKQPEITLLSLFTNSPKFLFIEPQTEEFTSIIRFSIAANVMIFISRKSLEIVSSHRHLKIFQNNKH